MQAQDLPKSLRLYSRGGFFTSPSTDVTPLPAPSPAMPPEWVVLDTNVLLDLLVFGDARAAALRRALQAGQLQALATPAMFDELADVLSRPFLARWQVDAGRLLTQARALCRMVDAPTAQADAVPRCADPDDQVFIDLAWSWPARWLFSRDLALLNLARKTAPWGLGVLTPAAWAALPASADTAAAGGP